MLNVSVFTIQFYLRLFGDDNVYFFVHDSFQCHI